MDLDTAEAVDTLRADIHRLEKTLAAKIGGVDRSLTTRIDSVESSLTAKMLELNEDAKRHADVLTESMRDDIKMLAGHVAALSEKFDSHR